MAQKDRKKKAAKTPPPNSSKPSTQPGSKQNMAAAEEATNEQAPSTSGSASTTPAGQNIAVRLVPTGASDLPILSNFARVQVSPSGVLVDFGFLEPAALNALARTARAGGKMPEAVNGRLAARFALTPDALITLHQQLGQAIEGLRAGSKARNESKTGQQLSRMA